MFVCITLHVHQSFICCAHREFLSPPNLPPPSMHAYMYISVFGQFEIVVKIEHFQYHQKMRNSSLETFFSCARSRLFPNHLKSYMCVRCRHFFSFPITNVIFRFDSSLISNIYDTLFLPNRSSSFWDIEMRTKTKKAILKNELLFEDALFCAHFLRS